MKDKITQIIQAVLAGEGFSAAQTAEFLALVGATEEWIGERETAKEMGIGHTTLYRWRNQGRIKKTGTMFPGDVKWRVTPAGTVQYELGSVRRYMLSLARTGAIAS
jgi:hypothetical protein